jgi:hypothetical protein
MKIVLFVGGNTDELRTIVGNIGVINPEVEINFCGAELAMSKIFLVEHGPSVCLFVVYWDIYHESLYEQLIAEIKENIEDPHILIVSTEITADKARMTKPEMVLVNPSPKVLLDGMHNLLLQHVGCPA